MKSQCVERKHCRSILGSTVLILPCPFMSEGVLTNAFLLSGASLVAQLVKNPPAMRETCIRSLGWEDPLEKGQATHSSIWAWRILWTEWVHKESDMTERLSLSLSLLVWLSSFSVCWGALFIDHLSPGMPCSLPHLPHPEAPRMP